MKSFKNVMATLVLVCVLLVIVPVAIFKSSARRNVELFSDGYYQVIDEANRQLEELPEIIEETTDEISEMYQKYKQKYSHTFDDFEREVERKFNFYTNRHDRHD